MCVYQIIRWRTLNIFQFVRYMGLPGGSVVKTLPDNTGDQNLILGSGRSSGEGNGNPLLYSCLGNPVDRGAWWATVCALLQSCPTLCDPMDCSPPRSSVHGILQARILEWVATSSPRGLSRPRESNPCLLCLLHWQAGSLPLVPSGKPCFCYKRC